MAESEEHPGGDALSALRNSGA